MITNLLLFIILGSELESLQYKFSTETTPTSDDDLKVCRIWTGPAAVEWTDLHTLEQEGVGTTVLNTVVCENGRTPVIKSLRIIVSDGVPIQVSNINIYAAGR